VVLYRAALKGDDDSVRALRDGLAMSQGVLPGTRALIKNFCNIQTIILLDMQLIHPSRNKQVVQPTREKGSIISVTSSPTSDTSSISENISTVGLDSKLLDNSTSK
jgi:hypothetical protein